MSLEQEKNRIIYNLIVVEVNNLEEYVEKIRSFNSYEELIEYEKSINNRIKSYACMSCTGGFCGICSGYGIVKKKKKCYPCQANNKNHPDCKLCYEKNKCYSCKGNGICIVCHGHVTMLKLI